MGGGRALPKLGMLLSLLPPRPEQRETLVRVLAAHDAAAIISRP
jgi:hypothetical protein